MTSTLESSPWQARQAGSAPATTGRVANPGRVAGPVRRNVLNVPRFVTALPRPAGDDDYPLANLQATSPQRPPDWRYRFALALLDGGRRPKRGDRHLSRVHGWLVRLRQQGTDAPVPDRLAPYRDALAIYAGPDEPNRAVLEAHLLARRSPLEAAAAVGLPGEVGEVYASAFYDAASRLHRKDFIAGHVYRLHRPRQPTLGATVRAFAVAGGPLLLDDLLHTFGLGHLAAGPRHQHADPVLHELSLRASVAAWLLPAGPRSARVLEQIEQRLCRLDALPPNTKAHGRALVQLLCAQVRGLKQAFGAAVRDHPFVLAVLADVPSPP
jgi:hypothetical protein